MQAIGKGAKYGGGPGKRGASGGGGPGSREKVVRDRGYKYHRGRCEALERRLLESGGEAIPLPPPSPHHCCLPCCSGRGHEFNMTFQYLDSTHGKL